MRDCLVCRYAFAPIDGRFGRTRPMKQKVSRGIVGFFCSKLWDSSTQGSDMEHIKYVTVAFEDCSK